MRKLYCILLVAVVFYSQGQTFNYADHPGFEVPTDLVTINSKSYYLLTKVDVPSCCTSTVELVCRGANNAVLFRQQVLVGPYVTFPHLIVSADQCLIVSTSSSFSCSVGGINGLIAKYDTTGSLTWTTSYSQPQIAQLLALPNSSFLVVSSTMLRHYTAAGVLSSSVPVALGIVKSACILPNGSLFVCDVVGSTSHFRILSMSGSILSDVTQGIWLSKAHTSSSGILYGIQNSILCKFSSTYSAMATSTISSQGISDFIFYSDTIYAVGTKANGLPHYYKFDTSLVQLHESTTNFKQVFPEGVAVAGNSVKIISRAAISSHSHSGFVSTPKNGNLMGTRDIGVSAAKILQFDVFSSGSLFQATTKAQLTIKNFSDTVRIFKINYSGGPASSSSCIYGLNQTFSMTIAPGETVSVLTNTFNTGEFSSQQISYNGVVSIPLCFFTSIPDHQNDLDYSNDEFCTNADTYRLGISESHSAPSVLVYPIPASSEINIVSDKNLQHITLTDLSGRIIIDRTEEHQHCLIRTTELSTGIYLLKIKAGDQTISRKITVIN